MNSKIITIIKRTIDKITSLTSYERKGFEKILLCRTEVVPHLFQLCDSCHSVHPVFKSCKHKMCPVCGGADRIKWLAKREAELLPVKYFLLTYTIPRELRPLFLFNKKICYSLLFKAVNKSLQECIKNNKRTMKGKAGFFAILHTWDQRINLHPHLHIVIPAGALSLDKTKWNPSCPAFFLPVRKLSADFRDKLLFYLNKEYKAETLNIPEDIKNLQDLLNSLKNIKWVVHSQAPGKGRSKPHLLLRYLSRYVNKTAVSDNRIQKVEKGKVFIGYYDRKRKYKKTEILSEELFIKRLVLHFLPRGFKHIRFYGFMANRYRSGMLILCRMLLGQSLAEQEEDKCFLEDTTFLFWKYFGIDITLCDDCGIGHTSIIKLDGGGG